MCGATACAIMRALGMNTKVCALQATPVSSGRCVPVTMSNLFSFCASALTASAQFPLKVPIEKFHPWS